MRAHADCPLRSASLRPSDGEKSSFLSGAVALLAPIAWPEPFGLVLIEAMACGTPVIAFDRGSVPEIVEDGLTGFVVESKEEAVAATDRLSRLSRRAIRRRFEERFTARRMAREYLVVYRSLIEFDRHSPAQDEKLVAAGGGDCAETTKRDKLERPRRRSGCGESRILLQASRSPKT
jgi:hypothetical protein